MVRFIGHLHLARGPSLMGRDEVGGRFDPRRLQIGHQTPESRCWRAGRPRPGQPLPAGYAGGLSSNLNRGQLCMSQSCLLHAVARVLRNENPPPQPGGFFFGFFLGKFTMSLSSAKNYALRAERSQDAKEAADLLAKAILELAAAIEATDAKVKKMNKSG
jgi:hypothetical protein